MREEGKVLEVNAEKLKSGNAEMKRFSTPAGELVDAVDAMLAVGAEMHKELAAGRRKTAMERRLNRLLDVRWELTKLLSHGKKCEQEGCEEGAGG
jgi:hypothetical protein